MNTVITDGGRSDYDLPFATEMGGYLQDCLVRAIAIASSQPYLEVKREADDMLGYNSDNGVEYEDGVALLELLNFAACPINEATIRYSERLGHVIAVIDGVPRDTKPVDDLTLYEEGWKEVAQC